MRRALLLLVLTSACGDGEARISFAVPDSVSALAQSVRLRLVRANAGDIDCDAIAYGMLDADRLDGATERTLVIDGDAPTQVGEIARATRTLFVAEAFEGSAASGALVAAGCADQTAVTGDDEVRIAGEAAVDLVGVDPSLTGGVSVAPSDVPATLQLTANDAAGNAVANVDVRVQVIDVAGVELTLTAETGAAGDVAIPTDFLATRPVGAVRVLIRARWQRMPLSLDTVAPPRQATVAVNGNFLSAIAADASVFVVTGDITAGTLHRLQVNGDTLTSTSLGATAARFVTFVRTPDGVVLGLWDDAYRVLDTNAGTFGTERAIDIGVLGNAVSVEVAEPCGGSAQPLILLSEAGTSSVTALAYAGGTLSVAAKPAFIGDSPVLAAGCIADVGGRVHRAIATATELRLEEGGVLALPASAGAIRLGTAARPQLIAAVQTTSGPEVRYYDLDAGRLELRDQVAISGNASFIDTVDLDGNSAPDLIAVVPSGSSPAVSIVYLGVPITPRLSALIDLTPTPGAAAPLPVASSARAPTLTADTDADGRVEVWTFRGYLEVGGVGPPMPQNRTQVERIDFTR